METKKALVLDCNKSRYDTYNCLFYNYSLSYVHFPAQVKEYLMTIDGKCDILLIDYPRRDEEFVSLVEWLKTNRDDIKKIVVVYDDNLQRDYIKMNLPNVAFTTYDQICKIVG